MFKAEALVEKRQSKIEFGVIYEVCIFICKMFWPQFMILGRQTFSSRKYVCDKSSFQLPLLKCPWAVPFKPSMTCSNENLWPLLRFCAVQSFCIISHFWTAPFEIFSQFIALSAASVLQSIYSHFFYRTKLFLLSGVLWPVSIVPVVFWSL